MGVAQKTSDRPIKSSKQILKQKAPLEVIMIKKIYNFIIDSWIIYCVMTLTVISASFLIEKAFVALLILAVIETAVTRLIDRRRKGNENH